MYCFKLLLPQKDNAIKNHWYSTSRRNERRVAKEMTLQLKSNAARGTNKHPPTILSISHSIKSGSALQARNLNSAVKAAGVRSGEASGGNGGLRLMPGVDTLFATAATSTVGCSVSSFKKPSYSSTSSSSGQLQKQDDLSHVKTRQHSKMLLQLLAFPNGPNGRNSSTDEVNAVPGTQKIPKRGKHKITTTDSILADPMKPKRGRPRKIKPDHFTAGKKKKKGKRGRPRKKLKCLTLPTSYGNNNQYHQQQQHLQQFQNSGFHSIMFPTNSNGIPIGTHGGMQTTSNTWPLPVSTYADSQVLGPGENSMGGRSSSTQMSPSNALLSQLLWNGSFLAPGYNNISLPSSQPNSRGNSRPSSKPGVSFQVRLFNIFIFYILSISYITILTYFFSTFVLNISFLIQNNATGKSGTFC